MNTTRAGMKRFGPGKQWRISVGCIVLFFCCSRGFGADPFAENVRPTDPLTPDQELKSFHLPPGFEVQLVAAEPDIAKPMNLAFDAQGRLWVTTSREYPFPATPDKPARDRIMIFEDFGPDGRARKVTAFAEGLNIPIGLYPFRSASTNQRFNASTNEPSKGSTAEGLKRDTWKCIAWSIPNIWLLEDTDGDGKADRKEKLYGPMGWERDTHGMNSSFAPGFDGWLYATHGYNNNTDVRGRDGNEVKMNSGNTYRFRPDGSRIEQNTWGQVNPFGLCFDALGNLYSADCHSEPVYQLLHGGFYPSFGKPHDGLGFAPSMIFHGHGSTAISGIVYYEDDLWPAEYRHNIFTGNVMTSRVNRDALTFTGSTPLANERPDFVSTDDPWFRPVNLQLGPDGAFYMADFYNRIIGHYEVPLTHPGRDRERGRIWRIVYKGNVGQASSLPGAQLPTSQPSSQDASQPAGKMPALRPAALPDGLDGLVAELGSANLPRRMLAMNEIRDRFGTNATEALSSALANRGFAPAGGTGALLMPERLNFEAERFAVHVMWLLQRSNELLDAELSSFTLAPAALVRAHALRILTERGLQAASTSDHSGGQSGLTPALRDRAVAALSDPDALVQRCAAEALGAWPMFDNLRPLLALRHRVERVAGTLPTDSPSGTLAAPSSDTHLIYVVRKALRDQLKVDGVLTRLIKENLSEQDARAIADVAVGVPTAEAGEFLLRHLQEFSENKETLANYLRHVARYAPEKEMDPLAAFTRAKFADDIDFQLALFKSIQQGTEQRGVTFGAGFRDWGTELAERLLAAAGKDSLTWFNTPVEGTANSANPWFLQKRASADGDKSSRFLSSLPPGGESLTGILRSKPFAIPARLSFFLAGHDGYPDKPAQKRNVVHLRAADNDQVLAESFPPRKDTAQPVTWNLGKFTGRQGYLEVADGDNGDAYAWLAIGRFDPPVVTVPTTSPNAIGRRQQAAAELVRALSLSRLESQLEQVLLNPGTDLAVCGVIAQTLVALHPDDPSAALAPLAGESSVPADFRRNVARVVVGRKPSDAEALLADAFRTLTRRFQTRLAESLAGSAGGAARLLSLVAEGRAPAAVLLERPVRDKLQASKPANLDERLAELTKGVAPPSREIQNLIDQRRANFDLSKASATSGEKVFTLNCRPCHQIDNAGTVVGPQLDGAGGRGLERLLEDVLDPNRNVDPAFHTTIVSLRDGDVVSGLFRREEGAAIVLANGAGKEVSIPKKDIAERRASDTSLMPENFGEIISPRDFNDLMAFLLAHGPKEAK